MSSHNNNSAQVQVFKDYQAIPDERDEVMSDFMFWLDREYDWTLNTSLREGVVLPLPKTEEELVDIIKQAIAQYLMQDEKSQALIKAGEQELLKKWSKNDKV